MKKYIPVDFDEKGNAVLGREKNTPTSNSFIPTTWAPGGDEGKQGLKSVTISPAIATTPAFESKFPIYWEDMTEEQKQGIEVQTFVDFGVIKAGDEYTITVTPTSGLYAAGVGDGDPAFGEKGEPLTFTVTAELDGNLGFTVVALDSIEEEAMTIQIDVNCSIMAQL